MLYTVTAAMLVRSLRSRMLTLSNVSALEW